ncbi:hypothetical protein G6F40_016465 [Rhizopus arrhizus]|nr:hypothetical protein G6F40_016465 [Rhizopus arrhizus]
MKGLAGEILVCDNIAPSELAQLQAQGCDPGTQPAPAADRQRTAAAQPHRRWRRADHRRRRRQHHGQPAGRQPA